MRNTLKCHAERVWRIVATGFCFSVFGMGGLLLAGLVLPLQRVFERNEDKRKQQARYTVHVCFKLFVGLMHYLGVIYFDVKHKAQFAQLKGQLVLANHPSLIDVVVLISVIKNADCVVKAHLFRNPFMRGVISSTGYISNEDPEGLLTDCKKSVMAGNNLIVFPEGTRTTVGTKISFKRGAANIAYRCKVPITCIMLNMRPNTLTKGTPWYQVAKTRACFTAQLSSAKFTQHNQANHQSPAMQARQLTRDLEYYFAEELKVYE